MKLKMTIFACLITAFTFSKFANAESMQPTNLIVANGLNQYACDINVNVIDDSNGEFTTKIYAIASDEKEALKFCLVKSDALILGGASDVYVRIPGWGKDHQKLKAINVKLDKKIQ